MGPSRRERTALGEGVQQQFVEVAGLDEVRLERALERLSHGVLLCLNEAVQHHLGGGVGWGGGGKEGCGVGVVGGAGVREKLHPTTTPISLTHSFSSGDAGAPPPRGEADEASGGGM